MEQTVICENTLKNYFQAIVESENFFEEISNWLGLLGEDRLLLLRHLIYEIDLSETEQLKTTLYEYGSYLTETNYIGRKLFSMVAVLIGEMEKCGGVERE